MLWGALLLFGVISFDRIGVDRFADIEFPAISIRTVLPGASPEIIDSSITNLVETSVNSVPGIEHIRSTSAPGVSVVFVRFGLGKDVDIGFNEVQAKVNQVLPRLPKDADPPVVAKVEFGSLPILWLALTGDRTLQQLNEYARNVIKKRLETIDGVGEVRLGGERERTIRVNLDPDLMAAFGIAANDVIGAFATEHVRLQGGFLVGGSRELLVQLDLEYHNTRELEELIVAYPAGAPIRLGDIAEVEDDLADRREFASFNGQPSVGLGIIKVQKSNTVAIVEEVERRLQEDILPELPHGLELQVAYSDADLIEDIVAALEEHILLGTLLTALVVLLFLKSLSATLIIAAAIPVSLLGTFGVMLALGLSINGLTMFGLILVITVLYFFMGGRNGLLVGIAIPLSMLAGALLMARRVGGRELDRSLRWLTRGYYQLTVLPFPEYVEGEQVADRSAIPEVTTSATLNFPPIEEKTLANGMKLVVASRGNIPLVNVSINVDTGAMAAPVNASWYVVVTTSTAACSNIWSTT